MQKKTKKTTRKKRHDKPITSEMGALAAKLNYDGIILPTGERKKYSQDKIGEMFGLTSTSKRVQIQKAIDMATQAGMVRFEIIAKTSRDIKRESDLFTKLVSDEGEPLLDLTVTRVIEPHIEDMPMELRRWEIGQCAAELIRGIISDLVSTKDVVVGVSCGSTLNETANAIQALDEQPSNYVHVVPTVGAFGTIPVEEESTTITRKIAERLGSSNKIRCYTLPSPGFVQQPGIWKALHQTVLTQKVVELWEKADLLLSGIGAMEPNATALRFWKLAGVGENELRLLKEHLDAAGDLTLNFLAKDGSRLSRWRDDASVKREIRLILGQLAYPIATKLDHLQKVCLTKGKSSIAVGIGPEKAPAFVAAVRGRYIDGIITDSTTSDAITTHWDASRQRQPEITPVWMRRELENDKKVLELQKKECEQKLNKINEQLEYMQSSQQGIFE